MKAISASIIVCAGVWMLREGTTDWGGRAGVILMLYGMILSSPALEFQRVVVLR